MTSGETDVCVMATILGAIDLGYRVILVEDAVCRSDDQTSDASLEFLRNRFSVELEQSQRMTFCSKHVVDRGCFTISVETRAA